MSWVPKDAAQFTALSTKSNDRKDSDLVVKNNEELRKPSSTIEIHFSQRNSSVMLIVLIVCEKFQYLHFSQQFDKLCLNTKAIEFI